MNFIFADDYYAFELVDKGLAGEGHRISLYGPINYLVFRIYEAAKQLRRSSSSKTSVLIIDHTAWWRFQFQLENRWIDWTNAQFVGRRQDADWNIFLRDQQRKYRTLPDDLGETIRSLGSIRIAKQSDFTFPVQFDLSTP